MSTPSPSLLGPLPDAVLEEFEEAFRAQQQATHRLWKLAANAYDTAVPADQEFLADELALMMNVHPRTGMSLMTVAVTAGCYPELLQAWADGHLTDRHVRAGLDELQRSLTDDDLRQQALARVLERCRDRAARGIDWPRPGELARMIRAAAVLLDLDAHRKREKAAEGDRGTNCYPLPNGQAAFALEGPAHQIIAAADAVRARALAASREPGESRTLAQLEFDLTVELLVNGFADGSEARVAVEVQVIVPVDTLTDDGEGLAELAGYGPVHPQTARDLTARATTLRRIDIDRITGRVVAVGPGVKVSPGAVETALTALLEKPLPVVDLSTKAYRPTTRAARFVRTRDQRCRFPGCLRRARGADLDHADPWPRGRTSPENLQCLCRHHHRAKQSGLFIVHVEPDGTTIWTLRRSGRQYRNPPPDLTAR